MLDRLAHLDEEQAGRQSESPPLRQQFLGEWAEHRKLPHIDRRLPTDLPQRSTAFLRLERGQNRRPTKPQSAGTVRHREDTQDQSESSQADAGCEPTRRVMWGHIVGRTPPPRGPKPTRITVGHVAPREWTAEAPCRRARSAA